MQPWQETLLRISATSGILAVLGALAGFALAARNPGLMSRVRSAALALVVLALLTAVAVAIGEVWR
jgi:hypothetical protein